MFFRVLSYSTIIIFFRLISSFIISKVTAIVLGPSGYALIGNFRNVFQLAVGISARGFESGAIKHIAEKKDDQNYQVKIISSLIALSLFISVFVGVLLFIFSDVLSQWTLKSKYYSFIFKYLALLMPLISANFLLLYITNGFQKLKTYTKLMLLFSVVNVITTVTSIYYFELEGACIAICIVSALTLLLSLFIKDVRYIFSKVLLESKNVSVRIIKSLSIYLVMAIYSTVLISVTYLLVRNTIISELDETLAGYWEAMNRISMFYMVFFTSIFTLYLLPNLSRNKTLKGYNSIIKSYFKRLIPLVIGLFTLLFLMRFFVIKIVLTEEFLPIRDYFILQLTGDFLKIIGFSLAYQFHAKQMVAYYFITDAIIYLSFYFLSIYLLDILNLEGVFYAHIISCTLYLFAVSFFIFTKNKNYLSNNEV